MLSFDQLQRETAVWQHRNFPSSKPHHPLLGLVEEVGELSHAHLKQEQGIRGTVESYRSKKIDAVGDIVIFLANYCTQQGLSFEECVLSAWNEVKQRDWQKDPTNGTNQRT